MFSIYPFLAKARNSSNRAKSPLLLIHHDATGGWSPSILVGRQLYGLNATEPHDKKDLAGLNNFNMYLICLGSDYTGVKSNVPCFIKAFSWSNEVLNWDELRWHLLQLLQLFFQPLSHHQLPFWIHFLLLFLLSSKQNRVQCQYIWSKHTRRSGSYMNYQTKRHDIWDFSYNNWSEMI